MIFNMIDTKRFAKFIFIGTLLSLLSACSFIPFFGSSNETQDYQNYPENVQNECLRNRASCIYEGPYEQGERNFAEQEARRLNQASLQRLRRMSVK